MPSMPVPLADFAERKLGCAGTISAADRLSPGLLQLRVRCRQPRKKQWLPGQEIEFRVGSREFRHYSVMAYDADAGIMSVLIHLHGAGPGSRWADSRVVGEDIVVLGPGGVLAEQSGPRRLLLGDASTVGTFAAMITTATNGAGAGDVAPAGSNGSPSTAAGANGAGGGGGFVGAVEAAAEDVSAVAALLPGLAVLPEQDRPGAALRGWLTEALATRGPLLADAAYLLGHAQTIQELRSLLRAQSPLNRRAIVTKPYWSSGKAGL